MGWIDLWEFKEKIKSFSDSTKREYFEAWLRMATKKKDLYMMRKLIEEENVDPNAKDAEEGSNCIHIAAAQRDATTLRFFLSLTTMIDLNAQDKSGETPLIIAIVNGCEEVVRILLAQPSLDVNIAGEDGHTALMLACHYGQKTILSMLLSHEHIQVNKGTCNNDTPLMVACSESYTGVVRLLLNREDLDVNDENKYNQTALTISCAPETPEGMLDDMEDMLDDEDIDMTLSLAKLRRHSKNQLELISMLLQREELETTAFNLEAMTYFVMNTFFHGLDINNARDMRALIEVAVSKNLLDIARWLLKKEGYLFRASTSTTALWGSSAAARRPLRMRPIKVSQFF